jgi:hypothetical protein
MAKTARKKSSRKKTPTRGKAKSSVRKVKARSAAVKRKAPARKASARKVAVKRAKANAPVRTTSSPKTTPAKKRGIGATIANAVHNLVELVEDTNSLRNKLEPPGTPEVN